MNFYREFGILLRARGLALKNHFTRPTKEKVIRWTLILVLGGLFLVGDYIFFHRIIHYLDELPFQVGEELIVQLINVVFLTFFAMVLFSSLIASLSIFYISSDSEFLHSLPVRLWPIIALRFYQTIINSSWMVVVFSFPMFAAYGYYFQVSNGFYVYLLVSFIPFIIIPCALGVLGIMFLIRFFPTQKVHQILSFMGLFVLTALVVFLRFLSPEKFFGKEVSDEMIMAFVESLRVPEYGFLPSSWITKGVTGWVEGQTTEAYWQMGYLFLAGIVSLIIFRVLSGSVYLQGWRYFKEANQAPLRPNNNGSAVKNWIDFIPMSSVRKALLVKDFKIFSRDPSQWSQMFILVALVIVYIFNIMNLPLNNLVLMNVISLLNIGLVGFVLSALTVRFIFSSISIEGKQMWTIYTSPVDIGKFLMGKFWMFLPPFLFIAEFLVVVSNYLLQVDAYVMNASIIGVFLITTGLVGLGVGMGAMYPMFNHENISEISTGTGGILFMISSMLYVGLITILSARPMYVHYNETILFRNVGGIEVPICFALIILLTIIVTIVPMRRGITRLKTMDI